MAKTPKWLLDLLKDPRVFGIEDERADDCGFWVYLKPGYMNPVLYGCHLIHEFTKAEVLEQLEMTEHCSLGDNNTQCKACAIGVTAYIPPDELGIIKDVVKRGGSTEAAIQSVLEYRSDL